MVAGSVSGSTIATRLLSSGTANVQFQLYTNSTYTTVWGNSIGTNTVSGVGTGSAQALTVFGQVPVQSTAGGGDVYLYRDHVGDVLTEERTE